ncbi:MAG TPA: hypothetical protein VFM29_01445 [Vicinamibacteria bacterium]|nr:hypothetical protein [Vicinamibacteria bacterium]
MKRLWLVPLVLVLAAGTAAAQEATPATPEEEDAQAMKEAEDSFTEDGKPKLKIKVLENPYDIASFYRQRQSGGLFDSAPMGAAPSGPYGLAGFYRLNHGAPTGYARFWTSGYAHAGRESRGLVLGFRRSIGENGDLFLFAPGILSPVGPLTGAFFRR